MSDRVRCPACDSVRVVLVIYPEPHAWCVRCDARWEQRGDEQRNLVPGKETFRPAREGVLVAGSTS